MNDFIDQFNSYPLGQRVLMLILLMVGIVVAFWFALLQPIQEEIEGQKSRLTELQREKERLDQLKRNKVIVLEQIEQLKRQLLIAQEQLPHDAEIPSLLQRVHNQAKTAGLEILKFERRSDKPKEFYVEIPVAMNLQGTYDELANFFYYVGRMTRIVNVKNISLSRKSSGLTPDGELKVSALATTFRYKSPPPAGGGGKKTKKK